MPTIARSRSPGSSLWRAALLALAMPVGPAAAQPAYGSGQEAYDARDWPAAETLWTKAAETGSAEAMLGLGNLYDFGLVGTPDPERAFDLYMSAARRGLDEAAFNVAAMLDSGVGTDTDRKAAAAWYGFAAVGGHMRARYNLGLMYAEGDGVSQNSGLARTWFEAAESSVPAARDAVGTLSATAQSALVAPEPIAAAIFALGEEKDEARFAWSSAGGPSDALFRVEAVDLGEDGPGAVRHIETTLSAAALPLSGTGGDLGWRVLQIDPSTTDYAASAWQTLGGEILSDAPEGRVHMRYGAADRKARSLALRLGGALERWGVNVIYSAEESAAGTSGVVYRYASDAAVAADIAAFVPGATPQRARDADAEGLGPGDVAVRLRFEPDATVAPDRIPDTSEVAPDGSRTDR